MIDVSGTPGFHFLCVSCEFNVIPQENCGLKKKKKKDLAQLSEISEDPPVLDRDSDGVVANPAPGLSHNKNSIESFSHVNTDKQKQKVKRGHIYPEVIILTKDGRDDVPASSSRIRENGNKNKINNNNNIDQRSDHDSGEIISGSSSNSSGNEKVPKECSHYKNNNCRHGISGRGCAFSHPKRCSKLMKHGTKKNLGCNLGKKCTAFHPKMCPTSIAKSECFDPKCQLSHVKGTKRRKVQNLEKSNSNETYLRKSNHQKDESLTNVRHTGTKLQDVRTKAQDDMTKDTQEAVISQQYFLDQINLLKKDFPEVVDQTINSLFLTTNPRVQTMYQQLPQNVIQPQMVPPHQSMMFQLPLNHSQVPFLHRQF